MVLPATGAKPEIRVLIVDDSPFMRRSLERLLSQTPGIRVVGTAGDGVEAVRRVLELRPDVITMDVEMPRMNGVLAVGEIMQTLPTPVVMVSTLTQQGSDTAIRALEAGAIECVAKPSGIAGELANVADQLSAAVVRASHARVARRRPLAAVAERQIPERAFQSLTPARNIVVIGSSTGGPPALTAVVPLLPAGFRAGVLIVQHMPAGFTSALARRLNTLSAVEVREAVEGDLVSAATVLVAPGEFHLTIGTNRRVHLDKRPSLHGVRPAIDYTLDSVADVYGRSATIAILTGMGRDGADGAAKVESAGGTVIVQDEASSVIYGMPKVARERTQNSMEYPISEIAAALTRAVAARS